MENNKLSCNDAINAFLNLFDYDEDGEAYKASSEIADTAVDGALALLTEMYAINASELKEMLSDSRRNHNHDAAFMDDVFTHLRNQEENNI